MMCLNALWQISEGNVEEVRRVVAQSRPLAYTTVLTLLDRLARRGAVSRRKEGRGFRYQPTVERDKLRRLALKQFLEYHFDGQVMKLKVFLDQPYEAIVPAAPGGIAPELEDGMIDIEVPLAVAEAAAAAPRSENDSAFAAVASAGPVVPKPEA
jgi:predicted transcriptional regulator